MLFYGTYRSIAKYNEPKYNEPKYNEPKYNEPKPRQLKQKYKFSKTFLFLIKTF